MEVPLGPMAPWPGLWTILDKALVIRSFQLDCFGNFTLSLKFAQAK